MEAFVLKYKFWIGAAFLLVGLSLIYIDWKFVSLSYPNDFQWVVAFLSAMAFLFFISLEEVEVEEYTNTSHSTSEYNKFATEHENNLDANKCYKGLDDAFFSFENSSDFDYFLNGLQNKVNVYREMRKKR